MIIPYAMRQDYSPRKKLIIHTCCAICGSEITDFLRKGYDPAIFFYNPNIYDSSEYERRRDSARRLAEVSSIPFFEEPYDRGDWVAKLGDMSECPEGGKRCEECFRLRLHETAKVAIRKNFGAITTTLATSPYKNEQSVQEIGEEEAKKEGLIFVDPLAGREKKEAWKKALQIAKEAGYYRQKYCGCEFSDYARVKNK
jgi:hypothetical protein